MRLLIVTQKVDRKDPILGFFHRWVMEFAKHYEKVMVIGQYVGSHHFPDNVTVLSLGKEAGRSRFSQVLRFWKLIWSYRREYHSVLVHMTPIWVVLGSVIWRITGRPVFLWYEARGKRWPLKVALKVVCKVFSASKHGMPIASEKSVIVGHGIDINHFKPSTSERDPKLLITVGRITKSKNIDAIMRSFIRLPDDYHLVIAGGPITGEDCKLSDWLKEFIRKNNLTRRVSVQCVMQDALLPLLCRATVFVHASTTSLDKAVLEAMASGCLVVSSADAVKPLLPSVCRAAPDTFAECIERTLALSRSQRTDFLEQQRSFVEREHGLARLVKRLAQEMALEDACSVPR